MTSPSTNTSSSSRVIDVINFLAAHPTESFTLTELAERLSLSHGSAHRVLSSLTQARYLSRHPKHKTYSLGLALVAIGQAALGRHHAVDVARHEMARLAEQLGVQCIASVIVDDEMLFVAKEGVSQTHDAISRIGDRRPFVPPMALGHMAWAQPSALKDYLALIPKGISAEVYRYIMQSIEVIRERGYSMASVGPGLTALQRVSEDHVNNRRSETYWSHMQALINQLSTNEIQLLSLDDISSERIGYIAAPVFSPAGDVALEISITGIPAHASTEQIAQYAERLRAASAFVTNETHGRAPKF